MKTKTEVVMVPSPTGIGQVPGKTSLLISARDGHGDLLNVDSKYVFRVQSLDTGESVDLPVDVSYDNVQVRQEVSNIEFVAVDDRQKMKDDFRKKKSSKKMKDVRKDDVSRERKQVKPRDKASRGDRW